jgi:2-polyprenyl-3-methyl-5-hydroxy-6-metoxy-1,4-benzoquinol methylase
MMYFSMPLVPLPIENDQPMNFKSESDRSGRKTQAVKEFYEQKYRGAWHGLQMGESRFTKMWYRAFVEHCVPYLSLSGSRVLEVGCGGGLLCEYFSARGASFFGVDLALSAVSQFPPSSRIPCFPAVANATQLPFRTGSFDLLLCMEVLEHTLEPTTVLDECFRVVRPSGYLVFSTPNRFSLTFFPKMLGDIGVPFFRRYVGRQIVDQWMTSFQLRRLLALRGEIKLQRAIRLHPPFFEQFDLRLFERNPLRGVNDLVFGVENRWGDRFPLNCVGQHTLCLVQAPASRQNTAGAEAATHQRERI